MRLLIVALVMSSTLSVSAHAFQAPSKRGKLGIRVMGSHFGRNRIAAIIVRLWSQVVAKQNFPLKTDG